MLASMLDVPCVTNVVGAALSEGRLDVTQLTEQGKVLWNVQLPAVVTLCEWSYPLRLPSIMGLRRARGESVAQMTAKTLGVSRCGLKDSPTRVVGISARSGGARSCQKLPASEVIASLRREGVLE